MPKTLQEIRGFHVGTILATDATDIPLDAASYSLNLDCGLENGVLQGVNDDLAFSVVGGNGGVIPDMFSPMSYLEIDGEERLVIKTSSGWHTSINDLWFY